METDYNDSETWDYFNDIQKNPNWLLSADVKFIDDVFNFAFQTSNIKNSKKSLEYIVKEVIKSQNATPELTLYTINKFMYYFSRDECENVIDSVIAEHQLRENLYKITEKVADVDLDWCRINNFVKDISNEQNEKLLNALKYETVVVLNSIKHNSSPALAEYTVDEIIRCLDQQEDLKLWFIIMKPDNLDIFIELCVKYKKLLMCVLKCFDKFADEIESTYDEELNIKYCHVNLDFDEFFNVFQLFYNEKSISDIISDFLEKRTNIENKNFYFWLDVKACLQLVDE